MKCPKCGKKTCVTHTREVTETLLLRWRKCEKCGCRFKTYEEIERAMLHVAQHTENTM